MEKNDLVLHDAYVEVRNIFKQLNAINVNEHTEKKGKLTYLAWAWAWAEVKKIYPFANYTVYENEKGWNYFTDGKTCWVKTGITIEGLEHIEYLPVMDYNNKSIPADAVTSFDVNKAIQRSLTKACARHGLGLYIYAGEDLPESERVEELPEYAKNNGEDVSMLFNQLYAEGKSHSEILKAICENKNIDFKRAGESVKKYVDTGKADDLNYKQLKSVINELCQG